MDFAIIDPKFGISENVPTVLLTEAFIAKGSENVHHRYGRYDRMRGRLPQLTDTSSVKIKAPTDVFAVTSVVSGTKTINITGDHSAGNTALAVGATIRINGSSTTANNKPLTVVSLPTTGSIVVTESVTTQAASGNVFVGTTPVMEYHRHIRQGTGTEHLLLGTKYHILLWLNSDKSLTVKWTNLVPADVTRWEIKDHLRNVVATNNSDFVLWWDVDTSVSNNFAALDTATGLNIDGATARLTKAKHITSYERYLMVAHTTEDGTVYPQRQRWASLGTGGSDIDFNENSSGDAGRREFTTTPGFIMGFARHGDDLVISKQDSMHRSWLVTADTVFEWEEYTLKVGNLSADSLVNDKAGRLYWVASDLTVREINTPKPISTFADISVKGLNTAQSEFIQATYIDEFEEIWFAFASTDSDTNDTVYSFHPDSTRSFIYKFPIRAFGDYTQQEAFTYDTLPFTSYDDWGADWLRYDTSRNVVGLPLDLASDYLGNTFDLHRSDKDDGADFTGVLIFSTTLSQGKSLNLFKRVNNGADLIFNRKSTGSVTLSAKRDTEKDWQTLGTASLVDTDEPETVIDHVPFDVRAKSFLYRLVTIAQMEFIGQIFRDFELDDSR